ncbi:hypothetical protein BN11_2610010 [Nostocoides australiense Ben110]|uniref:Uncharacterized protein n=1 Tax=Nostocoides australiense Ben110 TaxID=1193182 RepID=W6JX95_9MICO|nr:hypothetical protein BN11_2610010 [Tetrasphaera australiensis Ben110]
MMATRTRRPATDTRTAWRRLGRIAAPRMTRSNLFVLALAGSSSGSRSARKCDRPARRGWRTSARRSSSAFSTP